MIFKNKILDKFQIEAIEAINRNENVIVSAPTGTGKTLIADYAIEKCLNEGKTVVYTAPIKALSNQKYREFSAIFGKDKVGVLTGDTVINKRAPLLIMTTEIYRNILYSDIDLANSISCVIFDEIHYISDLDRGTVWEESILLKPKNTFLVGLSATIPNIGDLVGWIEETKKEKVNIVYHKERAVPLSHKFFCSGELIPFSESHLLKELAQNENDDYEYLKLLRSFTEKDFPILYFSFNRKKCLEKAKNYSAKKNHKSESDKNKSKEMIKSVLAQYEREPSSISNFNMYLSLFDKGIGIHHAGMLPILKLIVEELFENKLLDIVFCTETFAIGINFPVKTVCIDGYRKFDGRDFRNIYNKEYFQIGGRAGRRGIDDYGNVITMMKPSDIKHNDYVVWSEDSIEPLKSSFKISYNTAIQMVLDKNKDVERILKDNFAIYLMNRQKEVFKETKEYFLNETNSLKNSCCEDLGKNACPLHHKSLLLKMEKDCGDAKSKSDKNRKQKQLKDFKGNKINNCTKEQKKYCEPRYLSYIELAENYIKVKEDYKSYCDRYTDDYFALQYENKKKVLKELGYLDLDDSVLVRGMTLKNLYIQELLLSELIYSDFFDNNDEEVICGIIAGIDYDGKPNEDEALESNLVYPFLDVYSLSEKLITLENRLLGYSEILLDTTPCNVAYKIAKGCSISEIMKDNSISDGDIVSIARRTIAILGEIKEGVSDRPYLIEKIKRCIVKIDRDEYKALL